MPNQRRRAKDLRRSQTEAEAFVWGELRSRRFAGFKFRRQVPLGNYIVDFVCLEHGRVSGVGRDGRCHLARVAQASVAAPPKRPLTPDPSPARGEGSRVDEREQGQRDCRADTSVPRDAARSRPPPLDGCTRATLAWRARDTRCSQDFIASRER